MGRAASKLFLILGISIGFAVAGGIISFNLGRPNIYVKIPAIIEYAGIVFGILCLLFWIPLFFSGIYCLKTIRDRRCLRVFNPYGVYKYVRHPVLISPVFIILGIGLVANQLGVAIAGAALLPVNVFLAISEDLYLSRKLRDQHKDYMQSTPMFFPNPLKIIREIISR